MQESPTSYSGFEYSHSSLFIGTESIFVPFPLKRGFYLALNSARIGMVFDS